MFTWICPKCGREVPPAYSDCPNCAPKVAPVQAEPVAPPVYRAPAPPPPVVVAPPAPHVPTPPWATAPPPPPAPVYAAPVYAAPPPPPVYAAPAPPVAPPMTQDMPPAPSFGGAAYAAAPPTASGKGLPGWLVGILAVGGVGALLAILYVFVLPSKKSDAAAATSGAPSAGMTSIPEVGGTTKGTHPLAKFLEVVGVRVSEDAKQQLHVHFVVVNHSGADLPELDMNVTVKAGDKVFLQVPVKVPSIGPFESKDLETSAKSSLKGYELPDWQFLKADFVITSAP